MSGRPPTGSPSRPHTEEGTASPNGRNRLILLVLLCTVAAGAALAFIALSGNAGPQRAAPIPASAPGEKPLLTEFGDFQCPHCTKFALPALERDLIRPGMVRFEYRHYPFLGNESFAAAEVSECARDQGRFREYHDELLQLTARDKRLTPENLAKIAGDLELNAARFGQCLENGEKRARVLGNREYGSSLGVRGTPALFMDGRRIQWRNYPDLREQVLRRAKTCAQRVQ